MLLFCDSGLIYLILNIDVLAKNSYLLNQTFFKNNNNSFTKSLFLEVH